MEELKNIKRVSPSPFLKQKVMSRIDEFRNDTPSVIKWGAVAAIIINMLVIAQYINNDQQTDESYYQLFTVENTINY